MAEAPKTPKKMLSKEARKTKRESSRARGCWARNHSYIILYQTGQARCANSTGAILPHRKSVIYKNDFETGILRNKNYSVVLNPFVCVCVLWFCMCVYVGDKENSHFVFNYSKHKPVIFLIAHILTLYVLLPLIFYSSIFFQHTSDMLLEGMHWHICMDRSVT